MGSGRTMHTGLRKRNMTKKKNPRIGSSTDDLWQELGILEGITATAIKRTIALQIENEMSSQNISKAEMAAG